MHGWNFVDNAARDMIVAMDRCFFILVVPWGSTFMQENTRKKCLGITNLDGAKSIVLTYLRFIMLIRRMSSNFKGSGDLTSLPRYVGLNSRQGMDTVLKSCSSDRPSCLMADSLTRKSYSHETVLCSLPVSGSRGKSVSFRINVYTLSSVDTGR